MARQILPPLLLTLATCGAACRPDTDPSARRSSADNGSGRSVKRPADHRGYTASVFCLLGQGKAPNIPARGRPGFEARFERDARGAAQTIRCHRSTPAPETARERAGRASSRSGSHGRKGATGTRSSISKPIPRKRSTWRRRIQRRPFGYVEREESLHEGARQDGHLARPLIGRRDGW